MVYLRQEPAKHVVALLALEYLLLLPAALFAAWPAGGRTRQGLPQLARGPILVAYLVVALTAGWFESQGQLIPDENGYSFQAKIFASGKLSAAPLPGAPVSGKDAVPAALFFDHHINNPSRWGTFYPGGWPALLAAAQLLRIPWAANPLLGLVLLLIMAAIAGSLYDRGTGTLTIALAVLSPYFMVNCIGQMSHAACGVLLAAACWYCFRGLRTQRLADFAWMLLAIVAAFQVRPFTAAAVGGVLAAGGLWYLRGKSIWIRLLSLCCLTCVVCLGTFLIYTKLTTGSWTSPYLHATSSSGSQIDLSPSSVIHNLLNETRWGVQETVFYTFPFAFLLAAYAVWREKERPREVYILAAVFVLLIAAYLIEPAVNVEFVGERYYFEGFFCVLILAARGAGLAMQEYRVSSQAASAVLLVFAVLQCLQYGLTAPLFWQRIGPYRQVRSAAGLLVEKHATVFLRGSDQPFVGRHFNLNRADWQKGNAIFLVDPGTAERDKWACLMGRPEWVVIGFDPAQSRTVEDSGGSNACPVQ